jgi:hypothetical protein
MDEIFSLPGRRAAGNQLVVASQEPYEWLAWIEEKHSLFMGIFSEYPVITVTKLNSTHLK